MSQAPRIDAAYYIETLQMQRHIEGGAYKEHYRAALTLPHSSLSAAHQGARNASTAIYFLLEHGEFSGFHKLASDEVLHFYDGAPMHVYEIDAAAQMHHHVLGRDLAAGQRFSLVIPGGHWFALRCETAQSFALIGCTVAPGFDFADFQMDDRASLLAQFPQHAQLITEMTFNR
ncbi:cupin domain-containing protein [Massilia sp. W12]|uniref:cupin domain-containing protein n=1 Tax=Massilia sp. W12 TaxID=3126507 RepID=UPI0030CD5A6F